MTPLYGNTYSATTERPLPTETRNWLETTSGIEILSELEQQTH
ncbi:MAG: hypothetical protein NT076_05260 [Candidatus Pacearchaeota archaeon]|nr:hypothetical protein [Candidatus Pacearchaeota archaeon]